MKSLEEENKELKTKIQRLKARIDKLKLRIKTLTRQREEDLYDLREAKLECRKIRAEREEGTHRINPFKSEFTGDKEALLRLDDVKIVFDSPNDKAARLAKAICRRSRIERLLNDYPSVDEIYEWLNPEEVDWTDLAHEDRLKFSNDLYQWFRRINDKGLVGFNGQKIFEQVGKQYRLNPEIIKSDLSERHD